MNNAIFKLIHEKVHGKRDKIVECLKIFLLICLSFIFTLILLELILRTGGLLLNFYQKSFSREKESEEVVKILTVGESTTFGVGAKPNFSYPRQLQQILLEKYGIETVVINEGIPGITTTGILRKIDQMLLNHHPDIVLIQAGVNDYNDALNSIHSTVEFPKEYYFFFDFRTYKLAKLIYDIYVNRNKYSPERGTVYDSSLDSVYYQPAEDKIPKIDQELAVNFRSIIEKVKQNNAIPIFIGYPQGSNPILKEIARENGVLYIDTFIAYTPPSSGFEKYFSEDLWHPSALGYQYMANTIAKVLIESKLIK